MKALLCDGEPWSEPGRPAIFSRRTSGFFLPAVLQDQVHHQMFDLITDAPVDVFVLAHRILNSPVPDGRKVSAGKREPAHIHNRVPLVWRKLGESLRKM